MNPEEGHHSGASHRRPFRNELEASQAALAMVLPMILPTLNWVEMIEESSPGDAGVLDDEAMHVSQDVWMCD